MTLDFIKFQMNKFDPIIDQILQQEVRFDFAKSWWHGGQNVNKRETKAELYFDIHNSRFLNDQQKQRLIKLAGKKQIHHEQGELIMICQEERYQNANKQKVIHHFRQLLQQAFIQPRKRIKTTIPSNIIQQRLDEKKIISKKKQGRWKIDQTDF